MVSLQKQIHENGGVTLLNKYGGSPSKLVMAVYDNHQWQQSRFNTQPGYWNNKDNQRNFMDQLGNRLGFKEMDDWYGITAKQIHENGGVTLLNKYGRSPSKLVMAVYDNHQWQQSRFNTQHGYWNNKDNQRDFMDQLGNRLGFKEMDAWYGITQKQLHENGGVTLLNKYGGSPSKLVMAVYDNHQWNESRFRLTGSKLRNHWENKDNRMAAIWNLGRKLKIKDMNDWYRISLSQMKEIEGSSGLLEKYPLEKLLPEAYPDHQWDIGTLQGKGKFVTASQRWLKAKVEELFPQSGMKMNETAY